MRATLRRIAMILDGTPTGARGQSLVELTVTLPLLLVMLLGLAEIGWFANNYLNLLDTVREAGRFGATASAGSPLDWPQGQELNYSRMDCEEDSRFYDKLDFENKTTWPGPDLRAWGYNDQGEGALAYYERVACRVIRNMSPLVFKDQKDDIVVSIFQYVVVNPGTPNAQVRIYGRLPSRANECENDDSHDPFDWHGRTLDSAPNGSANDLGENFEGWDPGAENIRGYVFRGNQKNDYGGSKPCLGSQFSSDDIQQMLDFQGDADRTRKVEQATNFGLVLVEIFWSHKQLLGLPWFNIGPLEDGQIIHVWTFFPVSAAEPDVEF